MSECAYGVCESMLMTTCTVSENVCYCVCMYVNDCVRAYV